MEMPSTTRLSSGRRLKKWRRGNELCLLTSATLTASNSYTASQLVVPRSLSSSSPAHTLLRPAASPLLLSMSIVPERDPLLRSPSPDIEAALAAPPGRRTRAFSHSNDDKGNAYDVEAASSSSSSVYPATRQHASKPSNGVRIPNTYASQRAGLRFKRWVADNEGLVLIAAAQLLYSTMAALFKLLNDLPAPKPGAMEVIFIRMAITYAGCIVYMFASGTPHPVLGPPEVRHLLALRGFVGFGGVAGLYVSLQYLTLSVRSFMA